MCVLCMDSGYFDILCVFVWYVDFGIDYFGIDFYVDEL